MPLRLLLSSIALIASIACVAPASPDRRPAGPGLPGPAELRPGRISDPDAGQIGPAIALADLEEEGPADGLTHAAPRATHPSPESGISPAFARIPMGFRSSNIRMRLRC